MLLLNPKKQSQKRKRYKFHIRYTYLIWLQDRKEMKELDKVKQREVIDANSGPSLREIEITSLNVMLKKDNLKVSHRNA